MRAVVALCMTLGLIWTFGCRWTAVSNSAEDPELARETLIAALDAWKSGQVKSLAKRNPPIRFSDDDLSAGFQLTDYEIEEPEVPILPFKNVRVELVLRGQSSQTLRKTALYQVGIEPRLTVIRSDH